MNITKQTSYNNTSIYNGRPLQYIVIHYTAGVTSKSGSALNTALFFSNPSTYASADFIVDDSTAVQFNPDIENRYCWHCGDKKNTASKGGSYYGKCQNYNSIGIEVCSTNGTGRITQANDQYFSFTDAVVTKAVELTRYLMEKYNIPADRVIRHYDVTGKYCPGIIGWNANSGDESKWKSFKARLGGTSSSATTSTKTTTNSNILYRVQVGAYAVQSNAKGQLEKIQAKGFKDAFVVKVDNLYKVQVGAFSQKANAEKQLESVKKAGFNAFITTANSTTVKDTKKSVEEIAKEVIAGKWGTGSVRKTSLEQAGYDYATVQAKVNELLK